MADMNRCDTTPLLAYDDALRQLLAGIVPCGRMLERPLRDALGAVLAESIDSAIDVPGCAMSSMDGYAINSEDLADSGDTCLAVSQRIPAGTGRQVVWGMTSIWMGAMCVCQITPDCY